LLELYKTIIEKHSNTIKVNTLLETQQITYILLTLREMPKSELILVVKLTIIYTLPYTPKNDTSLENADTIAELTTQIIQILTAKTLEIILVRVNANEPFRVFAHLNYKI
jgi:hypothetical protein